MNLQLINQAKEEFREALAQGKVLSYSQLIQKIETEENTQAAPDLGHYQILKNWHRDIISLGFLDQSLEDLEEITLHNPCYITYKYSYGKKVVDSDLTSEDLQTIYEIIALNAGQSWNFENPFCSFYTELLNRKVRITMTHFSLSPQVESKVYIRFLNTKAYPLTSFTDKDSLLVELMDNKKNILIAGATGSGKTSFINALLKHTPEKDHLVILEDTFELVSPHSNTSRLLSNKRNENYTLNNLLTYSMRMSPDRLIIGEIRGQEVETFLSSINTGHKGVLTTVHSNNAVDALNRLALMFKIYSKKDLDLHTTLKLLCQNIDYVVYLEQKEVTEIIKVYSSEKENIFYEEC